MKDPKPQGREETKVPINPEFRSPYIGEKDLKVLEKWLNRNHDNIGGDDTFFAVLSTEIPDDEVAICEARGPARYEEATEDFPQCLLVNKKEAGRRLVALEPGDWKLMAEKAPKWKLSQNPTL